jgi:hypothetical protein
MFRSWVYQGETYGIKRALLLLVQIRIRVRASLKKRQKIIRRRIVLSQKFLLESKIYIKKISHQYWYIIVSPVRFHISVDFNVS